jgi:hypothetical protein
MIIQSPCAFVEYNGSLTFSMVSSTIPIPVSVIDRTIQAYVALAKKNYFITMPDFLSEISILIQSMVSQSRIHLRIQLGSR